MNAYRALFAIRQVPRLALAATLTRVAPPMLAVALLLAVGTSTGSYALGGLVLSAEAAAFAAVVPFTGRLVDRLGAAKVLPFCITAYVVCQVALAVALWRDLPGPALVALAAALGACTPPVGALIRSLWARIVPEERLPTAYALDAAITETAFIAGPMLVTLIVAVSSPPFVLGVITLAMGVGVGALLLGPAILPAGQTETSAPFRQRMLGALGHAATRRVLAVVVFDSAATGAVILGATAAAAAAGHASVSGVLLAAVAAGALASGLVYGSRSRTGRWRLQISLLFAGAAVVMAIAAAGPGVIAIGILMLALGLLGGPRDTMLQLVLGDAAPEHSRTESFAWMGTSMWLGYGLGTALSGRLVGDDPTAAGLAFLLGAAAAALAALLSLRLSRTSGRNAAASPVEADTKST